MYPVLIIQLKQMENRLLHLGVLTMNVYPLKSTYKTIVQQLKVEAKARKDWKPCEQYYKLVCQQAWKAWKRLPHSVKIWITIDDLINHGMAVAYQYITKHYDAKRSASITTGLVHVLHNFYIYEYLEVYGAWKRGWEKDKVGTMRSVEIQSLDEMKEQEREGRKFIEHISALVTSEDTIIDSMLTKCYVIPAMEQIYSNASPDLKREIVQWFWYKSAKVHLNNKPFQKAAKEFRSLAYAQQLTCNDALHLVRSPECLDVLSRALFQIPYDSKCSPVVN